MSEDELAFAAPPFKAGETLMRMQRELRDMGLSERAGVFERRGLAIARLAVDAEVIKAVIVKRPSRNSPEWLASTLKSGADARQFTTQLKSRLATWSDRDE